MAAKIAIPKYLTALFIALCFFEAFRGVWVCRRMPLGLVFVNVTFPEGVFILYYNGKMCSEVVFETGNLTGISPFIYMTHESVSLLHFRCEAEK